MKKIIATFILFCLMLGNLTAFAYECHDDNYICVTVNGKEIDNSSLAQIINGRTMVPVRSIAEALDATVLWDGETQEIDITKNNETIMLKIGSQEMSINNEIKTMDVAPIIINSSTLVPVRFVSEALHANIGWADICGKFVTISTSSITPEQAIEIVKEKFCTTEDYFGIGIEYNRWMHDYYGDYYLVTIYWRAPHDSSYDYEGVTGIGVHCETGETAVFAG